MKVIFWSFHMDGYQLKLKLPSFVQWLKLYEGVPELTVFHAVGLLNCSILHSLSGIGPGHSNVTCSLHMIKMSLHVYCHKLAAYHYSCLVAQSSPYWSDCLHVATIGKVWSDVNSLPSLDSTSEGDAFSIARLNHRSWGSIKARAKGLCSLC
jgi:hypothetical protein